jgi:hypothetical protein
MACTPGLAFVLVGGFGEGEKEAAPSPMLALLRGGMLLLRKSCFDKQSQSHAVTVAGTIRAWRRRQFVIVSGSCDDESNDDGSGNDDGGSYGRRRRSSGVSDVSHDASALHSVRAVSGSRLYRANADVPGSGRRCYDDHVRQADLHAVSTDRPRCKLSSFSWRLLLSNKLLGRLSDSRVYLPYQRAAHLP